MRKLTLLVVSVTCALLAGELGLRALGLFEPPPPTPIPRRPELYRADPELGYTLRPSTTTTYHYPPASTRVLTLISNADGFRNAREFTDADPRPRIWMLGDSMVLGEGVDAPDRLTEVLERLAPDWRVDNLGMTGWGPDLMTRAFERISRRVRPRVLVLAFYTDDFRRLNPYYAGQGYPFPKFELINGALIDVPFPPAPSGWARVRLVQATEQIIWRLNRNRFDLIGALLARLRRDAEPDVTLVVTFVPGRADTAEDEQRRTFLAGWCGTTRTPFLDLTGTFRSLQDSAFIAGNPHWNERGHQLAGEAIHDFLRKASLIR